MFVEPITDNIPYLNIINVLRIIFAFLSDILLQIYEVMGNRM